MYGSTHAAVEAVRAGKVAAYLTDEATLQYFAQARSSFVCRMLDHSATELMLWHVQRPRLSLMLPLPHQACRQCDTGIHPIHWLIPPFI